MAESSRYLEIYSKFANNECISAEEFTILKDLYGFIFQQYDDTLFTHLKYIFGFIHAVELLCGEKDNNLREVIIYPTIFDTHQALELFLKFSIYKYNCSPIDYDKKNVRFEYNTLKQLKIDNHDINELIKMKGIKEVYDNCENGDMLLSNLIGWYSQIGMLAGMDKPGISSRYPMGIHDYFSTHSKELRPETITEIFDNCTKIVGHIREMMFLIHEKIYLKINQDLKNSLPVIPGLNDH